MNAPHPHKPAGWFSGRTRIITIVSIVAVSLAGAAAVSANVGILDAASESDVGNVSVAGDLTPLAPQVVDVYLPSASSTTSLPAAGSTSTTSTTLAAAGSSTTATPTTIATGIQEFTVDAAGTVAVAATETGIRLERVTPTAGWTWRLSQGSPTELMVVLKNGVRTLEFVAVMTPDGNIAASVKEPIITQAPPASNGNVDNVDVSGGDFDDDDGDFDDDSDDDYEDDSDEDHDDSDEEHEGGDDDD